MLFWEAKKLSNSLNAFLTCGVDICCKKSLVSLILETCTAGFYTTPTAGKEGRGKKV
jgi:hypothetical protein